MQINQLMTFGDTRRIVLDTLVAVRDGNMDVSRGMAVAALFKELNANVQAEVNATKMTIAANEAGHDFGRVVGMGQRVIGNSMEQVA